MEGLRDWTGAAPWVVLAGTDPGFSKTTGIGVAMGAYRTALEKAGCTVHVLATHRPGKTLDKFLPLIGAVMRLPLLVLRLRRMVPSRPVILYLHAGQLPSLARKAVLAVVGRILGCRVYVHVHTILDQYAASGWKWELYRLLLLTSHQLVVLTPTWREKMRDWGVTHPVSVVPNPMSEELEDVARAVLAEPDENFLRRLSEPYLLAMTRLLPGKGLEQAIQAMTAIPEGVKLKIAGTGYLDSELRACASESGVPHRVHFLGWVGGQEKKTLLADSALFCLPSRFDSFGMGYLEAMAHGVPVIGLARGGVPDVVKNGETGILLDEDSPESISRAVSTLMSPEQYVECCRNCVRHVLNEFTQEKVGKMLMDAICFKEKS